MAQERASLPRTPQRAIQLAPNLIDSAHESMRSILVRLGANSNLYTLRVLDYDKRGPQPPRLSWQIF
eukprot:scaffold35706_cov71-Phaeocystis_antarctica.AAC.2